MSGRGAAIVLQQRGGEGVDEHMRSPSLSRSGMGEREWGGRHYIIERVPSLPNVLGTAGRVNETAINPHYSIYQKKERGARKCTHIL